jgi:4,5-dihydroxyphthalate decarboxylase
MAAPRLKTLLGDHAMALPLKRGEVSSTTTRFEFADVKVPNTAFKRVVRDLEFDVAELAIVTFLMAKDRGVPLSLLPVVLLSRFQHAFIVYDASRRKLELRDLEGCRVGMRSWTVTTAVWIRTILADDYNVDLDRISWVTFEDSHVAHFPDPPRVERARPEQDLIAMLKAGDIDAAIVGAPVADPAIVPLISSPVDAAAAWQRKYGAIQVNHLVAVKSEICSAQPDTVREIYRLLWESKRTAGLPQSGAVDLNPIGLEVNRRNLEVAVDKTYRQGLISRPMSVDSLICDVI